MPGLSLFLNLVGLLELLEGRVLHKGIWVVALLGTLCGVQDYKKVKYLGRDNSSLAVKGLRSHLVILILGEKSMLLCVALCSLIAYTSKISFTLTRKRFKVASTYLFLKLGMVSKMKITS